MAAPLGAERSAPVRLRFRNSETPVRLPGNMERSADAPPPPLKLWIPLKRRRLDGDGHADYEQQHPIAHGGELEEEVEDTPDAVEQGEFEDEEEHDEWWGPTSRIGFPPAGHGSKAYQHARARPFPHSPTQGSRPSGPGRSPSTAYRAAGDDCVSGYDDEDDGGPGNVDGGWSPTLGGDDATQRGSTGAARARSASPLHPPAASSPKSPWWLADTPVARLDSPQFPIDFIPHSPRPATVDNMIGRQQQRAAQPTTTNRLARARSPLDDDLLWDPPPPPSSVNKRYSEGSGAGLGPVTKSVGQHLDDAGGTAGGVVAASAPSERPFEWRDVLGAGGEAERLLPLASSDSMEEDDYSSSDSDGSKSRDDVAPPDGLDDMEGENGHHLSHRHVRDGNGVSGPRGNTGRETDSRWRSGNAPFCTRDAGVGGKLLAGIPQIGTGDADCYDRAENQPDMGSAGNAEDSGRDGGGDLQRNGIATGADMFDAQNGALVGVERPALGAPAGSVVDKVQEEGGRFRLQLNWPSAGRGSGPDRQGAESAVQDRGSFQSKRARHDAAVGTGIRGLSGADTSGQSTGVPASHMRLYISQKHRQRSQQGGGKGSWYPPGVRPVQSGVAGDGEGRAAQQDPAGSEAERQEREMLAARRRIVAEIKEREERELVVARQRRFRDAELARERHEMARLTHKRTYGWMDDLFGQMPNMLPASHAVRSRSLEGRERERSRKGLQQARPMQAANENERSEAGTRSNDRLVLKLRRVSKPAPAASKVPVPAARHSTAPPLGTSSQADSAAPPLRTSSQADSEACNRSDQTLKLSIARPCFCGESSTFRSSPHVQCSTPGCRSVQHLSCVGLPSPRPPHYCHRCRFKLVEAFWHPVEHLLPPAQANITPLTTRMEQGTMTIDRTMVITITSQLVRQLNSSGAKWKLRLACIHLGDTQPYRCHWPRQATLEVNGCTKKLFKRDGAKQLPDTQFDEAADISGMVKAGSNVLRVKFRTTRRFLLQLSLCKARTTDEVKALVCPALAVAEAHAAMKKRVGAGDEVEGDDSDSDLVDSGTLVLSLRCPLMGCRIKTPVIFKDKPGLPAMDLDSFLAVAKQTSRPLTCPHSRRHVAITQIQHDMYLQRVLQCLQSACHAEVNEVEVGKDGRWRPAGCEDNPWWSILDEPMQPYPATNTATHALVESDGDVVDLCDSDDEKPAAPRQQQQQVDDDEEEFNAIYNHSCAQDATRAAAVTPALDLPRVLPAAAGKGSACPMVPCSPEVQCISSSSARPSQAGSESSADRANPIDDFLAFLAAENGLPATSSHHPWSADGLIPITQSFSTHLPTLTGSPNLPGSIWSGHNPFGGIPATPQVAPCGLAISMPTSAPHPHKLIHSSPLSEAGPGDLLAQRGSFAGFSPFSVPSTPSPPAVAAVFPPNLALSHCPSIEDVLVQHYQQKQSKQPPPVIHPSITRCKSRTYVPLPAPCYPTSISIRPATPYVAPGATNNKNSTGQGAPDVVTCPWATSGSPDDAAPRNVSIPYFGSFDTLCAAALRGDRGKDKLGERLGFVGLHRVDFPGGAQGQGETCKNGTLGQRMNVGERASTSRAARELDPRGLVDGGGVRGMKEVEVVDLLDQSD